MCGQVRGWKCRGTAADLPGGGEGPAGLGQQEAAGGPRARGRPRPRPPRQRVRPRYLGYPNVHHKIVVRQP
jgi:hypothetical protein